MKNTPPSAQTERNGKKLCDCPCPGPYCNSLVHPCKKPDEHYPQRDQAEMEIRLDERTRLLSVESMKMEEHTMKRCRNSDFCICGVSDRNKLRQSILSEMEEKI